MQLVVLSKLTAISMQASSCLLYDMFRAALAAVYALSETLSNC